MRRGKNVPDNVDIETVLVNDGDAVREVERGKLLQVDDIATTDPVVLLKLAVESVDKILAATRTLKGYAEDRVVRTEADTISDEAITIRTVVNRYQRQRQIETQDAREARGYETWV